ncbi:hypothetical protein AAG906_017814 [Vitis piasezkii]
MRARLGRRSTVRRAADDRNWQAYPDPQSHPLFRTTSRTKRYDKPERTHQMNHPPAPLAKGWMTCSPRLLARISSITTPQGDSSCQNFLRMMGSFCGQYLCSAWHKQNIVLQNIKMKENESLREFVKWFGQVVLQVEAYSMDVVLQIFKRSICPGTPFFESLAKKPPTTMDDLFRRTSKYSMLENDVRAATQQILVAGQTSRSSGKKFQTSEPAKAVWSKKLLPMIQDLSDFRWPGPIRTDPSKRDHSKKCAYHKEHGHTTERYRSLHYLVGMLIKAGHLKQYLHSKPS